MMAVIEAAPGGLPQPTLSKSNGSRGFSISGLPGLTQRGTRHFLLNAHVAGRVLVLRQIANAFIEPDRYPEVGRAVGVHGSGSVWIEPDRVIHGILKTLLAAQIPFCGFD